MTTNSLDRTAVSQVEGILFDMDGVLIDSEPLHEFTLLELSALFGQRFETHEELQTFKGLPELTFGLAESFDAVITCKEVKIGKPDPEPYLLTATKLGVPAGRCLVIEDATNGVRSGKAAGCLVAAITTSFTEAALLEAGADFVAPTFALLEAGFFGANA